MTDRQVPVPSTAEPISWAYASYLYSRTILANLAHWALHRRRRHQEQVAADYDAGEWSQQREAGHWKSASSLEGYVDKEWRTERIVAKMHGRLWKVPVYDYYAFRRRMLIALISEFDLGASTLYELGSGTGSNLFALATAQRWERLVGLELSPTGREVAEAVADRFEVESTVRFAHIDLLDRSSASFADLEGAVAFTHYCLEQLPDHTEEVFRNLIAARIKRVIMIEPSYELLHPAKLSDVASLTYVRRQDYQRSIIRAARKLQREGLLKMVAVRRLDFVSGYRNDPTLLVWEAV